MKRIATNVALMFFASSVSAQEFSQDALLGRWEFVAYAEVGSPYNRNSVGVVYEFRPDGTLIAELPSGNQEWAYRVDGETLYFDGPRGEQVWQVRSFEPETELMLIDQPNLALIKDINTLMFMERR